MRAGSRFLAIVLAAGASIAAGAQEVTMRSSAPTGKGVRLGARDSGRRVAVRVGRRFTVELRANLSTGYSWAVASSGEPVVRLLGEPTFKEDRRAAGAGGTQTFTFRAEQAGDAALKLVYRRPWEKDVEPAEAFSVTVAVTK